MRFTFTATMNPGYDVENLAVNFTAPTWKAAQEWAIVFMGQIGYRHGKELATWEITLARKIKGN